MSASRELRLDDYRRYGRQMILGELGLDAQLKLQNAAVVVVGAGGLGCPALQYLVAAGIGRIGIVDNDVVELSNLQRQVLHSEATVGLPKVESAAQALRRLNSHTIFDAYSVFLGPTNAQEILDSYSIILDCTDNAPTRYLLSDIAVRTGKPLVSGAAQRLEGQLCGYNFPCKDRGEQRGPCYRCLFPKPPAPEFASSCEEVGILGAVTGVIGALQALEAIKLITGLHDGTPSMLLYTALSISPFRIIKLRSKRKTCPACGDEGEQLGEISNLDYVTFCGGPLPNWEERGLVSDRRRRRISAKELHAAMQDPEKNVLVLDVRPHIEFGICHLPSSRNVPLRDIVADPAVNLPEREADLTVLVCRLGNDSQIAADALLAAADGEDYQSRNVVDLIGGLRSWSKEVDNNFPIY